MTRFNLLAATAAFAALAGAAHAQNLVVNGDFSAGATGFTSGYAYQTPSYNALYPEGTYTVTGNPHSVHQYWVDMDPNNNELVVNGYTSSSPTVWEELNLGTVAGQTYTFSADAYNVCCNSSFGNNPNEPSTLVFQYSSDGGASYQDAFSIMTHPPGDAGSLYTASYTFTASGATSLRLVDTLTGQSGNDFAVDNISLTSAAPEPGTWVLMLAGVGLAGAALRGRRRTALAAA